LKHVAVFKSSVSNIVSDKFLLVLYMSAQWDASTHYVLHISNCPWIFPCLIFISNSISQDDHKTLHDYSNIIMNQIFRMFKDVLKFTLITPLLQRYTLQLLTLMNVMIKA